MNILSQNDPRWRNITIGSSSDTIGDYGCGTTCLAMLAGITPDQVAGMPIYANGDLIMWETAAQVLGLPYNNDTNNPAFYPTIVETRSGGTMHFIIIQADGSQVDPWDGTVKPQGYYPIIKYRNLGLKNNQGGSMNERQVQDLINEAVGKLLGKNAKTEAFDSTNAIPDAEMRAKVYCNDKVDPEIKKVNERIDAIVKPEEKSIEEIANKVLDLIKEKLNK